MGKHILVISQYFYPENFRINDMCIEWVKRGYKVTVVTGIPNYPQGKFYKGYGLFKKRKEIYKGVEIVRLPIFSRGKGKIKLALNYFSFVLSGWFWKVFTKIKPDLVFIFEVSPMTQALPGVWLANRRKIPCYLYVQDLWPENLQIVGGINNKHILKRVGKMVDKIYSKSTKILVTSNSFKDSIEKRGVNPEKVVYWPQYAEDFYIPSEKAKERSEVFKVIFTGNIGKAQGLEILPKVSKKLKENGYEEKIKFIIVGDGRNKESLVLDIETQNVESMFEFLGHRKPAEIPNLLYEADTAFLSFSDNELFKMTLPAKLQTYMACGKPILAVASGETENIINEAVCGFVSKPADIDALYDNIIKMMNLKHSDLEKLSINASEFAKKSFDKKDLMDKFDEYIYEGVL
ncbi:glycosyltransferase family 4 protein [Haploplasma axanthum]|nr:glycosyltransferase family 4 protein [Haploplasma axanthum]